MALRGAIASAGQAQQFQRQYRKDAGHQVKDDAAEQGKQQRLPPCDIGRGAPLRGGPRAEAAWIVQARSALPPPLTTSTPSSRVGCRAAGPVARVSASSKPRLPRSNFGSAAASTTFVIEREEARARLVETRQRRLRQGQADFLRRHGEAALEPGRFRQMAARAGKQRRRGRIEDGWDQADRQSQRQFCLARDADFRTHEPGGTGFPTARYCRVRCLARW